MKTLHLILAAGLLPIPAATAQTGEAASSEAGAPENAPRVVSRPYLVPEGVDDDTLKDAARLAAADAWKAFVEAHPQGIPVTRFAILPLQRDIDAAYVALQLRNQFTEICGPQGLELYTRMDSEWKTLLEEIAWGEQFGDTMDAETVQKFGRIQGVEALVFPRILGITATESDGVKIRLNVQVFEIETGRQLWGREIVGEIEGTLVPLSSSSLVENLKNHRQWIYWGGGALVALLLLFLLMRGVVRASRPR